MPEEEQKQLNESFDLAINTASKLKKTLAESAQLAGFAEVTLINIRPHWTNLAESAKNNPLLQPVLASGIALIRSYEQEMQNIMQHMDMVSNNMMSTAGTAITLNATTVLFVDDPKKAEELQRITFRAAPYPLANEPTTLVSRLSKLDPNLAQTYQQVWDALYATLSEPERSALFLMRQTIDHFFEILAPDDDVRKSSYWQPKEGDRKNQVTRRERIEYAAYTHVKDKYRAEILAASAMHMIDIYQNLNAAHKRGLLGVEKPRQTLQAMSRILEEWVDALGI